MTKQDFLEYYKKNKVVVIGVPVIICFLLLNQFVLKPAREKKKAELYGRKTTAAAKAAVVPTAKKEIAAPKPLKVPLMRGFSREVKKRFAWDDQDPSNDGLQGRDNPYPYGKSKNIFRSIWAREKQPMLTAATVQTSPVVEDYPDITYHGFFRMGKEKVAILKLANRLLLTKAGKQVRETGYLLQTIFSDRVVVAESKDNSKVFEIALMDTSLNSPDAERAK